jgi:hypothetical protein
MASKPNVSLTQPMADYLAIQQGWQVGRYLTRDRIQRSALCILLN